MKADVQLMTKTLHLKILTDDLLLSRQFGVILAASGTAEVGQVLACDTPGVSALTPSPDLP